MKKFLKYALRSKSIDFAKNALRAEPSGLVRETSFAGMPVYYREGTSDGLVLYEILFRGRKSEYAHRQLPAPGEVETILDIGANIGAATVFFAALYPQATIHSFEPVPGNHAMLEKNAAARRSSSIHTHLLALSDKDGNLEMIHSPGINNNGGWSFYQRGAGGNEEKVVVPVRCSGDMIRDLGISRVDIIKIDTEGAEREILQGMYPEQLACVKYIVGELHGERDFALLDWLEERGFDIECKKSFGKPCFIFKALRKS